MVSLEVLQRVVDGFARQHAHQRGRRVAEGQRAVQLHVQVLAAVRAHPDDEVGPRDHLGDEPLGGELCEASAQPVLHGWLDLSGRGRNRHVRPARV